MIYCKLEELEQYKGLSKNIQIAIEYLSSHELNELPIGKTVVDGENVYINKSIIETKTANEIPYEVHKKYIDIHIDLEGDENICLTDDKSMLKKKYDSENDYALYSSMKDSVVIKMDKNNYTIIFPGENHKPGIQRNTKKTTKCVVKILKK